MSVKIIGQNWYLKNISSIWKYLTILLFPFFRWISTYKTKTQDILVVKVCHIGYGNCTICCRYRWCHYCILRQIFQGESYCYAMLSVMFSFKMLFGLHAVLIESFAATWKICNKSCLWICSCQSLCMKTNSIWAMTCRKEGNRRSSRIRADNMSYILRRMSF